MSYRDESETLRARVEALEGELRDAKRTIARLKGEGTAAPKGSTLTPLETSTSTLWFGVPAFLVLRKFVDGEANDAGLQSIAQLIHDRLGRQGEVTGVARALVYRFGTMLELTLTPSDGGTHLQLIIDYRALALLGLGFAMSLFVLAIPFVASFAQLAWFLAPFLVAGFVFNRLLVAWFVRRKHATCRGTMEVVADIIREHPRANVRVAAEPVREELVAAAEDEEIAPERRQRRA